MSQYVRLGTQCESQTMSALTSNAKYIMPLSSVYYNKFTTMMYYPGMEHLYETSNKNEDPEQIKAYKIKKSVPKEYNNSVSNIDAFSQNQPEQILKSCNVCKN